MHFASDDVGMKIFARLEFNTLGERNLHFETTKVFRIRNGIDAPELEDQRAVVIPDFLDVIVRRGFTEQPDFAQT